jgi:hypothetical protein
MTYDRLHESYYGITEAQVEWVLKRCALCTLQASNKGKPPIKPIKVRRCLDHFVIDLMDFTSLSDGKFKWVLQGKCPFSRYILLEALEDKFAELVCAILKRWFGQFGLPAKL